MGKNKITLQIITPLKKIFDEEVEQVIIHTTEGDMGILYDHEPVVALLAYDIIRYKQDGVFKKATTMGGFVEVTADKVVVLTDASELPEDIDVERAKKAKERAEGHLSKGSMEGLRAEIALKKAILRLNLGGIK